MIEKRARMRQRVDTSANWAAKNPILLLGEIGYESDTKKGKIGDGVTAWSGLGYNWADATETIEACQTAQAGAEAALDAVYLRGYETLAALQADLTPNDGAMAKVTNDPTAANLGEYRKVGATGEGNWVASSLDRVALVENKADPAWKGQLATEVAEHAPNLLSPKWYDGPFVGALGSHSVTAKHGALCLTTTGSSRRIHVPRADIEGTTFDVGVFCVEKTAVSGPRFLVVQYNSGGVEIAGTRQTWDIGAAAVAVPEFIEFAGVSLHADCTTVALWFDGTGGSASWALPVLAKASGSGAYRMTSMSEVFALPDRVSSLETSAHLDPQGMAEFRPNAISPNWFNGPYQKSSGTGVVEGVAGLPSLHLCGGCRIVRVPRRQLRTSAFDFGVYLMRRDAGITGRVVVQQKTAFDTEIAGTRKEFNPGDVVISEPVFVEFTNVPIDATCEYIDIYLDGSTADTWWSLPMLADAGLGGAYRQGKALPTFKRPTTLLNGNLSGGGAGLTLYSAGISQAPIVPIVDSTINPLGCDYVFDVAAGNGWDGNYIDQKIPGAKPGDFFGGAMLVHSSDPEDYQIGSTSGPRILFVDSADALSGFYAQSTDFDEIGGGWRRYYIFGTIPTFGTGAVSRILLGFKASSAEHPADHKFTGLYFAWGLYPFTKETIAAGRWEASALAPAEQARVISDHEGRIEALEANPIAHNILLPGTLYFVNGRRTPLYGPNIAQERPSMGGYRATLHSQPTGGRPYLASINPGVDLDPDDLGNTATVVLQPVADNQTQYRKTLAIQKAAGDTSAEPKILCIGDSITEMNQPGKLKAKLMLAGATPTMIGTRWNGTEKGEGRGGWESADFTYDHTDVGAPLAIGLEGTYDGGINTNPFVRATEAGDDPALVKNGYIFDVRFYLDRFGFADPDIVTVGLGTNDLRYGGTAEEALLQYQTNMQIIVPQIRAALPNAKIGIIMPAWSTTDNALAFWASVVVDAIKWLIETYDNRTGDNIYILPHWAHQNADAAMQLFAEFKTSTDQQTGMETWARNDDVHFSDFGQEQYAEATFAWVMNVI